MVSRKGCRTTEVWQRAYGSTPTRSSCQYDLTPRQAADADGAAGDHPAMTEGLVGDVGVASTPARLGCSLKPTPGESSAERTVRPSGRSRGPGTVLVTPATSMQWRPGSPCGHRRARPVNSCGWRGGRSGRSSPVSTMTLKSDPQIEQESALCAGDNGARAGVSGRLIWCSAR